LQAYTFSLQAYLSMIVSEWCAEHCMFYACRHDFMNRDDNEIKVVFKFRGLGIWDYNFLLDTNKTIILKYACSEKVYACNYMVHFYLMYFIYTSKINILDVVFRFYSWECFLLFFYITLCIICEGLTNKKDQTINFN
jgi:hypothetical protein